MAKKQVVRKPGVKRPVASTAAGGPKEVISSYDKWIMWLVCAILIAVPLIFSRISYDQFDLVKLAVFKVLVLGIVVIWVAKMLTKPEPISWSWREGLLAAFVLVAIISTFTSIHIPTSLHGKYKRYEGLLTFITYITAYFVVTQTFKGKNWLRIIVEVVSITGGIVALYGILQFIGFDPIYWGSVPFEERRSFSTFGNPDLLAGYLVLAFPCALAAYFNKGKIAWLHGVSAFVLASGLLTALTRGGWLGALVSVICIGVLLGRRLKLYWKKVLVLIVPVAIVLFALVIYSSAINLDIVSKFQGAFQLNSGTALGRFEIWKAGWRMVKDRPLFGQGLDTYRLASEHFETKRYVQSVAGTTVSDNAHNYFIQLAAGGGPMAALLLYGFFIAWIVRALRIRRRLADDSEYLLVSCIIAAVIGYLATMLVGISIVGATSTFWLLMGCVTGFTLKLDPACRFLDLSKRWQEAKLAAAAAAVVVVTVVIAGFAVAMYLGDVYLIKGLRSAAGGQEQLALGNLNTAISLYPGNGRIMSELGQAYMRWASGAVQQRDKKTFTYSSQKAIESFRRASLAEPPEVDYRVFLANSYSYVGQTQEAFKILDEILLKQRPYSLPANLLYGQLLTDEKRKAEAVKYYKTALSLASATQPALSALADYYKEIGNRGKADYYQKQLDKVNAAPQ
ncbi:MAG: O-antigen ligase family protein [Actinomycetota bacterium]|nr:O-antigen ligase family protein [Actinomycetota bacterium]